MANGIVWYLGHSLDGATTNPVVAEGYDEADNLIYQIRFGGVEFGDVPKLVVANSAGHLFFALKSYSYPYNTYKTAGEFTRVYRRKGTRIDFPNLHGNYVYSLAIDPSDDSIYVGGEQDSSDSYKSLHKYNSAGVLQWSKSSEVFPYYSVRYSLTLEANTHRIVAIKIDSSGNIVTGSVSQECGEVHKYSSSGTLLWSFILDSNIYGLALDGSDNVYVICSGGIGYYALEDYDPDDVSLNRVEFTSPPEAHDLIKLDSDGNYVDSIYIATAASYAEQYEPNDIVFHDGTLYIKSFYYYTVSYYNGYVAQFDTDLAFISKAYSVNKTWENPNPSTAESFTPYQMDVNSNDGTVYLAGAQVYAKTLPHAVYYEDVTQLPALPISFALATPSTTGDRYNIIPALPLSFSLKAPTVIRDFAGSFQPPNIYRCYLTGGSGTIELPLASFSCRRGYGVMTINAVCPALTDAQVQQVIDRVAGNLIIKRGIKFANGIEQLDEMLVAPLSDSPYRLDSGGRSSSMTIDAKSDAEIENQKTRIIQGISYRNTANGSRRIRCSVDTYLRPGDTADLGGGETLIVGEITYAISPTQATMEISEAS